MKRVVIFGNSGAGKSTLAKELSESEGVPHFDLDTVAWLPVSPPERRPIDDARQEIGRFIAANSGWVIEGCYSDLLEMALPEASEIIFLNLSIEACISNAKNRPWEPHKYESKDSQDANLGMLIEWITQYPQRNDTFSKSSHEALFESYGGKKTMCTNNASRT